MRGGLKEEKMGKAIMWATSQRRTIPLYTAPRSRVCKAGERVSECPRLTTMSSVLSCGHGMLTRGQLGTLGHPRLLTTIAHKRMHLAGDFSQHQAFGTLYLIDRTKECGEEVGTWVLVRGSKQGVGRRWPGRDAQQMARPAWYLTFALGQAETTMKMAKSHVLTPRGR